MTRFEQSTFCLSPVCNFSGRNEFYTIDHSLMINYYEGLPIVRETNTGICGYYSFDMNDNESNKPCPDLQLKLQS